MRTIEPTEITTREIVEWTKEYTDYPASTYTLVYYFRGPGNGFNVTATADGDTFVISVAAATTAVMTSGKYKWQAWITEIADTANHHIVGEGRVNVNRGFDPSSTVPVETRTDAKIMLDTIDAALKAFAETDVMEYEISTPGGTRKVKRSDKVELVSQRKYWAGIVTNEIAREGVKNGKPLMQTVKMRVYDV